MNSKIFPYVIVGLASTVLLVLAILTVFIPVLTTVPLADATVSSTATNTASTNATNFSDPLITAVPKEQQSSVSKTKVFISEVDPKLGAEQPKVFVILFGDWSDTTAQTYLSWANDIVKAHPQDVAIIWKDYVAPEQLNEQLTNVALTAHCLNEQAVFWQATDTIVALTKATTINYAEILPDVGIDHGSVEDCVTGKTYQSAVNYGYYYGQSVGVTNGHTIFINDAMYTDVLTQDQLTQYINETLAKY